MAINRIRNSKIFYSLLIGTAILIPVFVFGGSTKSFNFTPNKGDSNPIYAIGDVNDVLRGHVSPSARDIYWPAEGIIGFGAATVGPLSGIGEGFMANGHAFVRQTDNGSTNYFQTVSEQTFRTPFSVYMLNDAVNDGIATFEPDDVTENSSVMSLYERIYEAVQGSPFCFYGFVEFNIMEAIAVSKAPIYGESLFGKYAQGYYGMPNFQIKDAYGIIFGCAANFSTVTDKDLLQKLSRALYFNPKDHHKKNNLEVHSHVLTLKRSVQNLDQITPQTALDVYHLLSNASIRTTRVNVFKINSSEELVEIKTPRSAASTLISKFSTVFTVCFLAFKSI